MALSETALERLNIQLENLTSVAAKLPTRAKAFVEDQVKRVDQWGSKIIMSPKQVQWLDDLHKEYCADAPPLPGDDDRERDEDDEEEDMDDGDDSGRRF